MLSHPVPPQHNGRDEDPYEEPYEWLTPLGNRTYTLRTRRTPGVLAERFGERVDVRKGESWCAFSTSATCPSGRRQLRRDVVGPPLSLAVFYVHHVHGLTGSAFAHSAIEQNLYARPSSKETTHKCMALRVAPRNDQ
jgi:hypothetical protein